uniref:Uncharacterized protein n=1 Tax=Chrysemys picta bellii TaxID=8478 RepID=A0A8C3HC84_CHRPI
MMKLWILIRHLSNSTNYYRNFPSYTLLSRHLTNILISSPYHPRCTIRMTYPQHTHQRCPPLLHMHLHPHRTGTLLWLIFIQRNLKHRNHPLTSNNSHCICRLRPTMGPNILLRCHRHYQPPLSHSICR